MFLYANAAYIQIVGVDPTEAGQVRREVAEDPTLDRLHPDDAERVLARYWLPAQAGQVVESEHRAVRPDGTVRWVHVTSNPVLDADGRVTRVAGTVEDITPRKNADAALRESEKRFEQLARTTEVGFLLRKAGQTLYMNPSLARIFGLDPSTRWSYSDLVARVHPDDLARFAANTAAVDRGEPLRSELRILRPDGVARVLEVVTNPVAAPEGEEVRTAITFTDITDRRVAENELRAARADSEHANAAKSEFLSRMSHELRTPMNAVLGFAQLLELEELTSGQEESVGHILRGGRHLLTLIDDVLDISRIESDQLDMSIEPVAVAELLIATVGLMQPAAAAAGVTLAMDVPLAARSGCPDGSDGPPGATVYARADRRRLQQVLLNLVSNAVKYNRHGGHVRLSAAVVGDTSSDGTSTEGAGSGTSGIRAEDIPRLFTPFDRLGQQATDVEGTGIGLALSHRLVDLMGGELRVVSAFEAGSTFSVLLPVALSPASYFPGANSDPGAGTEHEPNQFTSTLLYIEDNQLNADLMTHVVGRRSNWAVTRAVDAASGLDMARTLHPSLIMLDLHLPDMDGVDVLRALHADPVTRDIPVVIVSADASAQQVTRLLAAGAARYRTKPIEVTEILHDLDRYAAGAASATARPGHSATTNANI